MAAKMEAPPESPGGSVPIPDPTKLTTDAVNAATAQWRRDLESLREIIETRLTASDKAIEVHSTAADHLAARGQEGLRHLDALHGQRFLAVEERISAEVRIQQEKFRGIDQQFAERDVRGDQQARASADALAAALQAAKELVGAQGEASAAAAVKSETSFTKQLDQVAVIISTLEKALDSRITEMKERIDRSEGTLAGNHDYRADHRMDSTLLVGIIGVVVAILVAAAVIYTAVHK